MSDTSLIFQAVRLEIAVVDSLVELGCIHKYGSEEAAVMVEVPPENAHFDPQSGLVWVEVNPNQLPRRQSLQGLIDLGLQELVSSKLGYAVQVAKQEEKLVVICLVEEPEGILVANQLHTIVAKDHPAK